MRSLMTWVCSAAALIVVLGLTPAAQVPAALRVEPWDGDTRVRLLPLDAASEATYRHHFKSVHGQAARQFALELTNGTESTIAAVALRWTLTTPDGARVIIQRLSSHLSFAGGVFRSSPTQLALGEGRLVGDGTAGMSRGIRPGESVVVAPGMYYSEGRGGGGSWYPEVLASTAATARLDVVIFEDGLVVGPDELGTVDGIRARKAAIDFVLGVIRNAEANGQDPTVAIRELAQRRPASQHDPGNATIHMLAMTLLRAPSFSKEVEQWRALELPHFHR